MAPSAAVPPSSILLIEDNPGDRQLMRIALDELGVDAALEEATEGGTALALVRRIGAGEVPPPSLIVLDLNLPRASGTEVLQALRQVPCLRHVPVVVFTSSNADFDRGAAARCGATAYVLKPETYGDLLERLREVLSYLPRSARSRDAAAHG